MTYNAAIPGDALIPGLDLFEATPGMRFLFLADPPNFTILGATKDMCAHLARSREELVGKGIFQAFPSNPSDPGDTGATNLQASLQEAISQKVVHELSMQRYDLAGADGSFAKRYWKVSNQPVFDGQHAVRYVIHTSEEITHQVEATELKERMKGLEEAHHVFLQAPVVIGIVRGSDHILELANEAMFTLWDKTGSVIGKPLLDAIPELKGQPAYDRIEQVYKTGQPFQATELPVTTLRDGQVEQHYYDVYFRPFYEKGSASVSGVFTISNDATERVEARKQVEKTQLAFRNTLLQAPVAMAILKGPQFIIEIANKSMYELWGRPESELLHKSIFAALPEVRDQGYEELLESVYATGERFTALGIPITLPRNGIVQTVYINLLYEAFREPDGTISGVIAVATDVTEQVTAKLKVEESQKEFQFVTDFTPQLIWVTRADGFHYYYNKQWYDYTGLTYGETGGEGWNQVFHPDDQGHAWDVWRNSLDTGEPYEIEYRCRRWDGEYRWFLGRALPLKDDSGTVLKWFGTCTDIDDQKKATQIMELRIKERTEALQTSNQELSRSNRKLEEFAHAASHDMKEPIRKILTFSSRLRGKLGNKLDASELDLFERMDRASYRMSHLVEDILSFSLVSQTPQEPEEVDLDRTVADALTDLELLIEQKTPLFHFEPLPIVWGYRRQLQQLFQNLVGNALKYSKAGVPVEIRVSARGVRGGDLPQRVPAADEHQLFHLIEVRDTGIGFEAIYAERVFGMFQRLHGRNEYDGSGVGLSIARKVVENHKGYIWADSKVGAGSTFSVLLPKDKTEK